MRRDYYNLCSQYKAFFELTENGRFSVKRMQDTKLEACVRKPLAYTPLKDDANFAKAVVADVGDQPGDLALMQLAVTLAWDWHADYPSLTEAYSATGRVTGALAKLADEVYHNKLSDAERELVEPLLIRLVRLGDTAGATRRIVGRNELLDKAWALAQKLASRTGGRLLVSGGDERQATIELSHEALVTQWPLYQSWLQAAVVEKRIHDSLMPRARQWVEADTEEKSGFLLSGNDLDQALKLSARQPGWLSSAEADLIATSQSHHIARQRRDRRKTRAILAFAVISMVFAVSAGLLYSRQTDLTQQARQSAERAKNARSEAEQLMNFMTFDFREKLVPIGRLDLMKDVQLRVNNYYAHLGIEGQNKEVLRRQAVNYFHHGEIAAKQGNLETAIGGV
jgi:hypothetical protein